MVEPNATFHVVDYAIFGSVVVISITIGIYYALSGGRQKTVSEYLVGGRSMKFVPAAISLMVSVESSIMMLGLPAEVYVYGVQWWINTFGYLTANVLAILISVPLFHPLGITSVFQYLELRFKSATVRQLGSLLGILTDVWYMGIVLFGPAIALEAVTGFSQWSSIFITAGVAIVYTSIGGLKAVIWTDVFQAIIMYSGIMAILIKGTVEVGGPTQVWEVAKEGGRLNFFNFDFDPRIRHTFWGLYFGSVFRGIGSAFDQITVQRISAIPSKKQATRMMLLMAPGSFIVISLACYEGVVAYAYYQTKGCDPLASKKITNPNQVIPLTVMDIFQAVPGMPGLFLASLFSASFSTLSSALSAISAQVWMDFIKPRVGDVSELTGTIVAKITVFVAGGCACGVALLVSLVGGPLTQISASLLSAFSGPLLGVFLLGCFFPCANAKGVILGSLGSALLTGWITFGQSFSKSVRETPWLPSASIANCLANQSLSLLDVTSSGLDSDSLTFTSNLPGNYGNLSVSQTTPGEEAALVPEPQGIGHLYTLSYVWLRTVGILTTVILGAFISWCTGGNKEGEVDGRYLIPVCDYLCCCLPQSFRQFFRCAGCVNPHQTEETTGHDGFCIKETIINPPGEKELATGTAEANNTDLDKIKTQSKV